MSPTWQLDLEMDGVFDHRAVDRIAEALACVHRGGVLRIDLSGVQDFQDHAIAHLAQMLASSGASVRIILHGLGRHQVRILRYLGIDLAALEAIPLQREQVGWGAAS